MQYISVVIPLYNCAPMIPELCKRLVNTLEQISSDFEVIFINDASPLNDWDIVLQQGNKDSRIKGINLSRNFGQHYAITAGLTHSTGEWIIVMDGDLQDRPEEIIKFYKKAQQGYQVVLGRRMKRKDGFLKKFSSRLFFSVYNYLTDANLEQNVGNFAIYAKEVISSYSQIKERGQALILFAKWLGFNQTTIEIEHNERAQSKSGYSLKKLISLASENIICQSNKPLKLFIRFGMFMSLLSVIYGLFLIYRKIFMNIELGWTSIMVSIFFIGGLLFANLGIIGIYLGKIFEETKNRPLYLIKEKKGL